MQVMIRPLQSAGEVQEPTEETVWDVLHGAVIAAESAGAPAKRVRLSAEYTPLLLSGNVSGAFQGDPPRMIAQAGADRGAFEVWEDMTLEAGTAVVE